MAYVDPITDEDEKKKAQNGEGVSTTPEISVLESNGKDSGQAAVAGGKGPQSWTNLQTYIGANADQSGKLGQDVGQNVDNKIQNIDEQQKQYSSNYNAQKPNYNPSEDRKTLGEIARGDVVKNQPKISNLYNAQYTGPANTQSIGGYSNIEQGYKDAGLQAQNLDTEQGRSELLKSTYGSKQPYSSGEQSLDSFILGAGEQGRQAIEKAQNNVANSKNSWKKTLADISADIGNNQQYYDNIRGQAQQAVNSRLGDFSSSFQANKQALDAENAKKVSELSALQDYLKTSPSQAYDKLGLSKDVGNFLSNSGFDFNSLYSGNGTRKLGDVVGSDDIRGYNALSDITGRQGEFDFGKTGNASSAYNVDLGKERQAEQAQQLSSLISKRLQDEQAKRDRLLEEVKGTASPFTFIPRSAAEVKYGANLLGISESDYKKALDNGIDINQYISSGKKLNAGDVTSKDERSQWDSLRGALGLGAAPSYDDTQDEGAAYSIGDLLGAIQAIQAPSIEAAAKAAPTAVLGNENNFVPSYPSKSIVGNVSNKVGSSLGAYANDIRNAPVSPFIAPMLAPVTIVPRIANDVKTTVGNAANTIKKKLKL